MKEESQLEKKDKTIVCKDCGKEFTFSVRDQEFYERMGFENEPVRCRECRDKRKAEKNNRGTGSNFNNFRREETDRAA